MEQLHEYDIFRDLGKYVLSLVSHKKIRVPVVVQF